MAEKKKLFGTDGVRGRAGEGVFTAEGAVRMGKAFGGVLEGMGAGRRVLVVRDTRVSGEMLEAGLAAGLSAMGFDVLLGGVLPTPAAPLLMPVYGARAAAVISASHNAFEDNGFKFFGPDGSKLPDEAEAAVEERYFAGGGEAGRGRGGLTGRVVRLEGAAEVYVSAVLGRFPGDFRLDGVVVAVDGANGAGCVTTPMALRRLGACVRVFHAAPDGVNINEGCGSTRPEAVCRAVRETGAVAGLAHDGDADRVVFADETGSALDGDEVLAIAGRYLLERGLLRGKTVVATVLSNSGLEECLAEAGGRLVRTDVGDRHVAEAMRREGLSLGGEQSGHFIFADVSPTGDGLVSALAVLRIMAETGKPLSELRRALRKRPQAQVNVRVNARPALESLAGVRRAVEAALGEFGGRGRVLLRYSGTEPLARVLVEGPDAEMVRRHADAVADAIREEIGE